MKNYYFLLVLCLLWLLTSCANIATNSDSTTTEIFNNEIRELCDLANEDKPAVIEGSPFIGIVMPALDHPAWIAQYSGTIKKIKENNAGAVTYSAHGDVSLQIEMINKLIDQKVDGIIFTPTDSLELSKVVKRANQAGIPIIAVDRSTIGDGINGLVESDNIEIGKESARQMAALSKGKQLNILNLQGNMSTSAGLERNEGFLSEISLYDNCTVVYTQSGDWMPDKGYEAVIRAFQLHPEINAIYAPSDLYVQGVAVALEQVGRLKPIEHPEHVLLVTVDGQPAGLEYIRKSYVDIDVGQKIPLMGEKAVEMCLKLIKGEKFDNPVIKLPPEIINKSNIDNTEFWGSQFK